MFLDRFLADVFIHLWRKKRPQFSTLFLNAAAHIQHHYMFSSAVYDGPHSNPPWYCPEGADPLLEVYTLYDQIIDDMRRLDSPIRLMLATGLHQDPCPTPVYYYRLRDHARFLKQLGVTFDEVLPLMSRDFTITCRDTEAAHVAADRLSHVVAPDGTGMFFTDVRDKSVFCMLTYPGEISAPFLAITAQGTTIDMAPEVAFVALKNGIHNGEGYFIDTASETLASETFPLTELYGRMFNAVLPVSTI
jgi:hypothetical protein